MFSRSVTETVMEGAEKLYIHTFWKRNSYSNINLSCHKHMIDDSLSLLVHVHILIHLISVCNQALTQVTNFVSEKKFFSIRLLHSHLLLKFYHKCIKDESPGSFFFLQSPPASSENLE